MKKSFFVFLAMFTIVSGIEINALAQQPTTEKNKIFIDAKGGIHDHGGTKIGYIDKDNIVRNNQGKKLYFIDKNGNVIDANGKNLGKARKDGSYYNIKGENVLTVKDKDSQTCEILDPKGHSMGTVHKNYKLHACAAHCFFLTQKQAKTTKTPAKPAQRKE